MSLKKYLFSFLAIIFFLFCIKGIYFCYNSFGSFNRIIFPRAYGERDIEEEYKNNFFIQNQFLCYIDTYNNRLEFVEKMNFNEYKNEKFINKIPCILLHDDNKKIKNKKKSKERHLVVYFGGNGETIYYSCAYNLFKEILEYTDLDVDFLIICYPGYACDSSTPSADNFYKYSDSIAKYISSAQTVEYKKIHFLAFSIGCAMAVDCVTKVRRNSVVSLNLINPFTNIKTCAKHMISNKMPFLNTVVDKVLKYLDNDFDNLARIKKVNIQNLNIIFSSNDTMINNKNSLELYKNADNCKMKKLYEVAGDHCDWREYDVIKVLFGIKINKKLLPQKVAGNNIKNKN